ncbi:N-succinylarginine dihydrolase [Legionella taurinensis]|uniref:N-succinylarginine dihydrolase n=1 Tax=Legionella taurinensis TaxID=70611 RepID=A0A3A5L6B6_9GAMM|nr:N-succinylarginine dihydrolase [Legionella taurinensis]MDX1836929.1 N-succinylarginine dihydrolase [Legionella taurinensis]PUT41474.1 N-succinylarginine dihydrolase [Legionella taurinensis]PUT42577.1 N-succinylarginine dihydrolase [Legionella taurinensis]PUT46605.1 N-succinylarginine dihydrolase [Legionella taurinensis]PUT47380.1 N-succinylarginine dihydrolase [Legionella taurinensis]
MDVYELNLDGLVGPTHHYAGLAEGNIASMANAQTTANPQAAALQGLEKMRFLHQLGLKQALLPPHQRPNLHLLHQLGFRGSPSQQISKAYQEAPQLLSAAFSASGMWAANAATVSSSLDTQDNKVHFTAANLISNLHRHQEAPFSSLLLKRLFHQEAHFTHHPPLPPSLITGDEGAANHNRLCKRHNTSAIHLFVYGKKAMGKPLSAPTHYPARQTLEASHAIARSHQLDPAKVVYARQNPEAIDQGVFHNDVISVANESVFLVHEGAFAEQRQVYDELRRKADFEIQIVELKHDEVTIEEAVSSYLFNSQLLTLPDDTMAIVAPKECERNERVRKALEQRVNDPLNPIHHLHFLDVKQSMRNGGGPACLRLRVPLTDKEFAAMHQGVVITEPLLATLKKWVIKHYRTHLQTSDLVDPQFLNECLTALDELTQILHLGSLYPFQCESFPS